MPTVHEPHFSLHGVFKTTGKKTSEIIEVGWVGDLDQLLVLREPHLGSETQSVDLVAAVPCLKLISLLGNKESLQEELNRVLSQTPQT